MISRWQRRLPVWVLFGPLLVAAALGHGSFAITARHYTDPSALRNAALRRVSSALSGTPKVDPDALIEMLRALEPPDLDRVLASVGARR